MTVGNLAQVLRRTLERTRRTAAPLGEEIDYLKAWLAVEKERWGDRLRVSWRLADDALQVPVPPLTLQPLVENALKHGLSERPLPSALTPARDPHPLTPSPTRTHARPGEGEWHG